MIILSSLFTFNIKLQFVFTKVMPSERLISEGIVIILILLIYTPSDRRLQPSHPKPS